MLTNRKRMQNIPILFIVSGSVILMLWVKKERYCNRALSYFLLVQEQNFQVVHLYTHWGANDAAQFSFLMTFLVINNNGSHKTINGLPKMSPYSDECSSRSPSLKAPLGWAVPQLLSRTARGPVCVPVMLFLCCLLFFLLAPLWGAPPTGPPPPPRVCHGWE